jgi:NADH:ubiquinone oxidoreductase subunit C
MDKLDSVVEQIRTELGSAVESVDRPYGDVVLTVAKNRVHDALSGLKARGFDLLLDIAGVDGLHLARRERFEIVYFLYSMRDDLRLRVKAFVPENDMNLPTATDLWQAANWAEREAYDMFGFQFEGHPNLVRILCHREFVGHALRKDYPVLKGQWATGTSDLRPDLERE